MQAGVNADFTHLFCLHAEIWAESWLNENGYQLNGGRFLDLSEHKLIAQFVYRKTGIPPNDPVAFWLAKEILKPLPDDKIARKKRTETLWMFVWALTTGGEIKEEEKLLLTPTLREFGLVPKVLPHIFAKAKIAKRTDEPGPVLIPKTVRVKNRQTGEVEERSYSVMFQKLMQVAEDRPEAVAALNPAVDAVREKKAAKPKA